MSKLTVTVDHDSDVDAPMDSCDGEWRIYSFSHRHNNYKHPETLGLSLTRDVDGTPIVRNPGLRRKLQVGLAFFLSYFEHGQCVWSLRGEGPRCQFDSVDVAGLMVWEHPPADMGAKTYEHRQADARSTLGVYTDWCNGECFHYTIKDEDGEDVDSCGGFIGSGERLDYMWEAIRDIVGANEVDFADGDCGSARDTRDAYMAAAHRARERKPEVAK